MRLSQRCTVVGLGPLATKTDGGRIFCGEPSSGGWLSARVAGCGAVSACQTPSRAIGALFVWRDAGTQKETREKERWAEIPALPLSWHATEGTTAQPSSLKKSISSRFTAYSCHVGPLSWPRRIVPGLLPGPEPWRGSWVPVGADL